MPPARGRPDARRAQIRSRAPDGGQARLPQFRVDAVDVVELRRAGWRIGLLTDSTCETQALWPGLELHRLFDATAFSCAEGRTKPDPLFYGLLVRRLGVGSEECLYDADGRSGELAGAARLGMQAVQLVVDDAPPGTEDWRGEKVRSPLRSPTSPSAAIDHQPLSCSTQGNGAGGRRDGHGQGASRSPPQVDAGAGCTSGLLIWRYP